METSVSPSKGIFDGANSESRQHVVELLSKAYWMEIETVMSYLAASVNLDGVRAQEIKESLGQDIEEELGHARLFASRIKELYGVVPGSEGFAAEQSFLQPSRGADRRRARDPRRDQGRDRRDRALHADRRGDRSDRPGDPGHGDRHPP